MQSFLSMLQDAWAYGSGKKISAYIALLERNDIAPLSRGDYFLRYVASTPDSAPFLLGKCLFKDMKGIRWVDFHTLKIGCH